MPQLSQSTSALLKKIWSTIWPYLPLLLVLFLSWQLSSHVHLVNGDDTAYLSYAQNKSLFDFLAGQYQNWSGRLIPEGLLYLFIKQDLIYWRFLHLFLNSLIAFCLSYLCVKPLPLSRPWPKFFLNLFIVFGAFLFNYSTLVAGAFWVTASFNFLLPAALILFTLIPLQKFLQQQKSQWWLNTLALLAITITSYQEQAAIILLLIISALVAYDFYKTKRPNWWLLTFLFFSLANTLIGLLAPGNFERFTIESKNWYPELAQLSFFDKLWRGSEWVTQHFFTKEISLWLLFVSLLTLLLWQKTKNLFWRFGSLIISLFLLILFIFPNSLTFNLAGPAVPNSILYHYSPFILIFILILLAIFPALFFLYFQKDRSRFTWLTSIYLAALAGTFMMIFSPTIYASGRRVFLLFDFLLLYLILYLFSENFSLNQKKRPLFYSIILWVLLLLALFFAWEQYSAVHQLWIKTGFLVTHF